MIPRYRERQDSLKAEESLRLELSDLRDRVDRVESSDDDASGDSAGSYYSGNSADPSPSQDYDANEYE